MEPINYPSLLADNDGDGEIVSSGKIAALGKKGQVWIYKGQNADGSYLYWPKGYTTPAPVEPVKPVQHIPTPPTAPTNCDAVLSTMGFLKGNATVKNGTMTGSSAGRKLKEATIIDSVAFTDLKTVNIGRLIYMPGGASIRNMTLDRVDCSNVKPGQPHICIRGLTDGNVQTTVNDLKVVFSETPNTDTGDFPTGFQGGGKGAGERISKITINRAYVEGAISKWSTSSYWNGDGVAMERCVDLFEGTDIDIKRCIDGGLDSKAKLSVLLRVRVEGCLGNFKLWDNTKGDHLISINPVDNPGKGGACHFRVMGGDKVPTYELHNIEATGSAPLFWIENGPVKIIATGTYDGKTLVGKTNGGKLAAGSTWNGQPLV